ncbi:hypothetical protein ACQR35_13235 [Pseudarthrobacter sp. J1738]|uniref:hypothetical protein n=1 Tax=Pseudarthrobacter sp. J1738 TaxID=3420446 RepID=UPI003D265EF7
MANILGWHTVAGILAAIVAAVLGTVMGFEGPAQAMFVAVAYVGVTMFVDHRRRKNRAAVDAQLRELQAKAEDSEPRFPQMLDTRQLQRPKL